jgi:hypothetical protein
MVPSRASAASGTARSPSPTRSRWTARSPTTRGRTTSRRAAARSRRKARRTTKRRSASLRGGPSFPRRPVAPSWAARSRTSPPSTGPCWSGTGSGSRTRRRSGSSAAGSSAAVDLPESGRRSAPAGTRGVGERPRGGLGAAGKPSVAAVPCSSRAALASRVTPAAGSSAAVDLPESGRRSAPPGTRGVGERSRGGLGAAGKPSVAGVLRPSPVDAAPRGSLPSLGSFGRRRLTRRLGEAFRRWGPSAVAG